jgi:hypothetical protein
MSFESIRNRIAKLGPKPPGWRRKPTTAENRQELEAALVTLDDPNRPRYSGPVDLPGYPTLAECQAILQDQIDMLDKRVADDARYNALSWAEKLGAR